MKTIEYILPVYTVYYFAYGDIETLSKNDLIELEEFENNLPTGDVGNFLI
jgi:hypothetical protein